MSRRDLHYKFKLALDLVLSVSNPSWNSFVGDVLRFLQSNQSEQKFLVRFYMLEVLGIIRR